MTLQDIHPGPLLEQVFDQTFPLWGDGLTRQAYARWNTAQTRTRWGQQALQRVGLVDDGQVMASGKRYLFDATIGDARVAVLGLGAVYTPEAHRGRGFARRLIDAMLDDGRARGCVYAVLFSEIGPEYYARQGFVDIPRVMVTIDVPRSRRGAPGTLMRTLEPADLPEIALIAQRHAASSALAIERPPELVEFAIARKRLRAGLGPDGLRSVEAFVSEEGHKPVSWIVVTRGPEGVALEDCGDRDPSGARVGAMLEALMERDPSNPDRTLRAWLPPGMRPPQVRIGDARPPADVMMVRSLVEGSAVVDASIGEPYWPALDVF